MFETNLHTKIYEQVCVNVNGLQTMRDVCLLQARYEAVQQGPVFNLAMCSTRISPTSSFLVSPLGTEFIKVDNNED